MGENMKGKSPEELRRLEKLKALQMADLGTSRREVISTHDVSRNRGPQRGQLGTDRECDKPGTVAYRLAQANKNTLDAWSSFHTTVTDTDTMEELADINDGQSHRRALNDHFAGRRRIPQLSGPGSIRNHPAAPTSLGRGGGRAGTNRRGSYTPPAAKSRAPHYGGIVKNNNNHRSVSMTAGSRLDPSLSMNNNDISPHARGRGRGRKGGLDHGRVRAAPRQSPLPRRVSRAERPVLIPDMSTSLSDTASFLSIMKARSMVMPKLSTAPLESLSIKAECRDHLVEKPVSAELPFASFPVTPHMKAHYRDQPLSERMTPKPYHDQPLAERMTPKTPTPSRAVPLAQTSASSKSMGPAPTSQTTSKTTAKAPIERTGSSIHVKDLKWKISADEFPRKKGAVSPVSTTMKNKVLPVVKLPPVMQTELKRSSSAQKRVIRKRVSTQNILDEGPTMTETCTQTGAVSSIIPSEDLINFEVPTPPRNTAFASPSAVVLQGLDFTIPVVPFASSPSSIYVSADAESQRGGLGFSDVISTQNEDPGVEFFDIIGNTMSKGMGTLFKDAVKQAYAKGYGIPVMRSGQSEDPSIAQSLATRSTQEPLRSVSTATRDMSHLEQWLQKANNAMEGSSFEKHRSPHGSSPGSASLNPSTCMPVPGLSPQKSEYSEIDTKPIEFMRRLDTIKPIDFTKSVEVPSPPQNQISVASRSSKPSVKYAGLLDSKYASGPPVSFTKFTKKKAPGSNAKTVPHDMASRMVSRPEFAPFRPQTAPARPPGLAAPARPPGLPVRSQAIIPHLQTSTRVLSESTSNVHKPVGSTGVRTIGPAPSVFEPTTLRGSNETAASLAFVRQPAARMPLQAENWSANIAPAISDFDALRRVSNLTFPSSSPSQVIGPNSGLTLPGFSPNPLTKPGDKAVRKVSTLGPAPFTPRK